MKNIKLLLAFVSVMVTLNTIQALTIHPHLFGLKTHRSRYVHYKKIPKNLTISNITINGHPLKDVGIIQEPHEFNKSHGLTKVAWLKQYFESIPFPAINNIKRGENTIEFDASFTYEVKYELHRKIRRKWLYQDYEETKKRKISITTSKSDVYLLIDQATQELKLSETPSHYNVPEELFSKQNADKKLG